MTHSDSDHSRTNICLKHDTNPVKQSKIKRHSNTSQIENLNSKLKIEEEPNSGIHVEAEAVSSSQRILRRVRDKNHSGTGGVHSRIGEWEQFVGEEGMGFKLLNKIHHCNIVMDRRQRMRNKRSEGGNKEDPMTMALDPRG